MTNQQSEAKTRGDKSRAERNALEDMVWQFAYRNDGQGKKPPVLFTGGLSALEHAFSVLGWPDPKPCPDASCDIEACQRWPHSGNPMPDGDYWNLCSQHSALMRDLKVSDLEKKPGRGYNAKERKERLARR